MAASVGDDGTELNLTPLLDVVLQLVMFFMMCANFVMEENNEKIKVPDSVAAKPMERPPDARVIVVSVDSSGLIYTLGNEPFNTQGKVDFYMKQQYRDDQRANGGKVPNTVVDIRGDKDADSGAVYIVMRSARSAGYTKIRLRSIVKAGLAL